MGHTDLEFVWGDKRPVDPSDQQKMLAGYVKEGIYTRNEARDVIGMNPIPGGDDATVEVAGQGILLVEDLKQISDNLANPPPPPAPALPGSPGGNRPGTSGKKPARSQAKPGTPGARPAQNAKKPGNKPKPASSRAKKGVAKTLYVHRRLKNADELRAWAKDAGFKSTLDPEDMHVTVAFSKDPLDWDAAGDHFDEIQCSSGQRALTKFGDAVVLTFESTELAQRWQQFRDAGASWDFEDYIPHVTLTYRARPTSGPEIYSEIGEDWANDFDEVPLGKTLADRLAKDGHVDPDNVDPVVLSVS